MPQPTDYYLILGVSPLADEDDIKRAYRALAKRHHPDRVPAERREWARAEMTRINAAYEVLGDPLRRAQYHQRQGYEPVQSPPETPTVASRRHTQRVRERSRRGHIERQRIVTLSSAALLGLVLVAALAWFRWLGLDSTTGRCAWAIVLAVGMLLVLAALRLTEL